MDLSIIDEIPYRSAPVLTKKLLIDTYSIIEAERQTGQMNID